MEMRRLRINQVTLVTAIMNEISGQNEGVRLSEQNFSVMVNACIEGANTTIAALKCTDFECEIDHAES